MDKKIDHKLQKIFKEILNMDEFDISLSMDKVDTWDSLKHLELITSIENTFGIEIEYQDALKMTSIAAIIEVIKKHAQKTSKN